MNLYGYCGGGPVGKVDPEGTLIWGVTISAPPALFSVAGGAFVTAGAVGMVTAGAAIAGYATGTGINEYFGLSDKICHWFGWAGVEELPAEPWVLKKLEKYAPRHNPDLSRDFWDQVYGGNKGDGRMWEYRDELARRQRTRFTKDECDAEYDDALNYIQNLFLNRQIGTANRRVLRELAYRLYSECLSGAI